MKKLIVWCCWVLGSCTEPAVNSDTPEGLYNGIVDPIRCSLPTVKTVRIHQGILGAEFTMEHIMTGEVITIKNIQIKDSSGVKLFVKNKQNIATLLNDSYYDFETSSKINARILFLRFQENDRYFEFMGKK